MGGDQRQRILLVDDDDSIRQVVTVFLTDEGYDVTGASDGQAALDALSEEHEAIADRTEVDVTSWGTREFHVRDPYGNGRFYADR